MHALQTASAALSARQRIARQRLRRALTQQVLTLLDARAGSAFDAAESARRLTTRPTATHPPARAPATGDVPLGARIVPPGQELQLKSRAAAARTDASGPRATLQRVVTAAGARLEIAAHGAGGLTSASSGASATGSSIGPVVGRDRWLAVGLGALVLVASIVSVAPPLPANGGTGNTYGPGVPARISISALDGPVASNGPAAANGTSGSVGAQLFVGVDREDTSATQNTAAAPGANANGFVQTAPAGERLAPGESIEGASTVEPVTADASPAAVADGTATTVEAIPAAIGGPFLADGTLLKPLAVDTTVPDATSILRRIKVRAGDTLATIAKRYGVSQASVWSSNYSLKSPTAIHAGMSLLVPPVNGEVHVVAGGETIQDIATRTKVSISRIMAVNKLNDQTLFIGQTLVIPGVAQRAYPKPKPKSAVRTATSTRSSSPVTTQPVAPRSPVHYSGGRMTWPVPGGFISQYYHYGHWAIDIAAPWGNPVLAAAPGVVTFAGWKNNGGGYQVWMSHGNNIYTTYNHMSAILVGVGQELSAGQQLGRIGATGDATGPHLHFEVWVGPIWDGGQRMNPLNYL